ncbi:MAG: PIN domain-containing protein [bacterium]|nr:PIN domain-containing protein [bacterium]
MPGNKFVLVDSDALIGLICKDDALHARAIAVSKYLSEKGFVTMVPYPIVLEAATALFRGLKKSESAKRLLEDYSDFSQPELEERPVAKIVPSIFNSKSSKKNTPFDCYLAALARLNKINLIFSFDSFYKKQGLTLAEELIV